MLHRFVLKLIRRRRLQQDLETELAFHREMAGVHQNAIPLGNSTSIKEQGLELWRFAFVENILRDVFYAVRSLRRTPVMLICALVSLGLGIGANTAIFELLDAMRWRMLPVYEPQQLAQVEIIGGHHGMGVNPGEYPELSRPVWEEVKLRQQGFSAMFAWNAGQVNIGESDRLRRVKAMWVSGEFSRVLGLHAWRGRLIAPEDAGACTSSVAAVSYAYWQDSMGGVPIQDAAPLLVDGMRTPVIGVLPPEFAGLSVGDRFDIILPLCRPKDMRADVFDIAVMARLRPGWTLQRASEQLKAISAGIFEATAPSGRSEESIAAYKRFRLAAYDASTGVSVLREQYDSSLWLLLGVTGLVLLIACANLANLLLARASTRDREMAVRLALGASRKRLLQQLLAEGALLATIGGAFGLGLAQLFSRILIWGLSTEGNSVILPIATDGRVLLFTCLACALTCIVFGAVPARRAATAEAAASIKPGNRGTAGSLERSHMQRFLVIAQIAISLILLVAAFLFVRSFRNLLTYNPGMREAGITVAFINFDPAHVALDHYYDFERQMLLDVRSIPGVLNAASTTNIPLVGGSWEHGIHIEGRKGISKFTWVSPDYFQTMGIPVVMGRNLAETDTGGSQRVAIVNQTFVNSYLPGQNPLGKTLRTIKEPGYPSTVYQIVGVIPDTKYSDIRAGTPPMAFAPASQFPDQGAFMELLVYSNLPENQILAAVKREIAQKHPDVVTTGGSFQQGIRDGMVGEKLMAILAGFFGALAALLASIGLYGVIAYLVANRRPEIGIRMALGAGRGQVISMVLKEASGLLVTGILIGIIFCLIAGRSATALLFGVKPYDALTLLSAMVLLASISALAAFVPAHRAARLDPMIALRYD